MDAKTEQLIEEVREISTALGLGPAVGLGVAAQIQQNRILLENREHAALCQITSLLAASFPVLSYLKKKTKETNASGNETEESNSGNENQEQNSGNKSEENTSGNENQEQNTNNQGGEAPPVTDNPEGKEN